MTSSSFSYAFFFFFTFFYVPCLITAQKPNTSNNGVNKTCQSFLIYKTQPPYNTVSSIASLFSANASQITAMNNIVENTILEMDTRVIIPVTLSSCGNLKKKWEYFWEGVAVGAGGVSVLGIILFCIFGRKFGPTMSSQSLEKSSEIQKEGVLFKPSSLKVYNFKDLEVATENFSSGNVIKANLHGDVAALENK